MFRLLCGSILECAKGSDLVCNLKIFEHCGGPRSSLCALLLGSRSGYHPVGLTDGSDRGVAHPLIPCLERPPRASHLIITSADTIRYGMK